LAQAGCSDPLSKPVDLFHGLEGGEIAAERPPPPGAGQPYPHIGTVPAKPVLPTPVFRTTLQRELAAERDQKELLAADLPQERVPPPPSASLPRPAETQAPAAQTPQGDPAAGSGASNAGASNATISAADAPPPAKSPAPAAPPVAPQDAQLQIVGEPEEYANLPLVPDGPPLPAPLADVPAATAPAIRSLPRPVALPSGKPVYFADGSAILTASQNETLDDIKGRRGNKVIDIIGLGEAASDTPLGQEAAIDLALRRARAIAAAFAARHVPQTAMRISARPYGRGALVRLLP